MFQTINTASAVEKFLNENNARLDKIDTKIDSIVNEIEDLKKKKTALEDQYVNYELSDDATSQAETLKEIQTVKEEISILEDRKAAYERQRENPPDLKGRAAKIQLDASKEIRKIYASMEKNRQERKSLEDKLEEIQKQIDSKNLDYSGLELEISRIVNHVAQIGTYLYSPEKLKELTEFSTYGLRQEIISLTE